VGGGRAGGEWGEGGTNGGGRLRMQGEGAREVSGDWGGGGEGEWKEGGGDGRGW